VLQAPPGPAQPYGAGSGLGTQRGDDLFSAGSRAGASTVLRKPMKRPRGSGSSAIGTEDPDLARRGRIAGRRLMRIGRGLVEPCLQGLELHVQVGYFPVQPRDLLAERNDKDYLPSASRTRLNSFARTHVPSRNSCGCI
jgi:hypothetical protein